MLTRVESLEAQNEQDTRDKQENKQLTHATDALNERLTRQNDVHKQEVERLFLVVNDGLSERLTRQSGRHQEDVERLTQENDRLSRANTALEQRVERLEAVNSRQQTAALNPSPGPDIRSQFTAFACTGAIASMSCPNGRTIFTTSGVYGLFDSDCSECCAPNPQYDCTELVEESRPSDWLAIQALCDGETSCQFDNLGIASLTSCSAEPSEYIQLFYDCLPDAESDPVAFTAFADTGSTTHYGADDIMVFNEVLANAGGHYNAATSSFTCPWDGLYLIIVDIQGGVDNGIHVELMRNDIQLTRMYIASDSNRGSTTLVIECHRGDVVWTRAGSYGEIYSDALHSLFTGHILHRF